MHMSVGHQMPGRNVHRQSDHTRQLMCTVYLTEAIAPSSSSTGSPMRLGEIEQGRGRERVFEDIIIHVLHCSPHAPICHGHTIIDFRV